jgi:hypothetical protein
MMGPLEATAYVEVVQGAAAFVAHHGAPFVLGLWIDTSPIVMLRSPTHSTYVPLPPASGPAFMAVFKTWIPCGRTLKLTRTTNDGEIPCALIIGGCAIFDTLRVMKAGPPAPLRIVLGRRLVLDISSTPDQTHAYHAIRAALKRAHDDHNPACQIKLLAFDPQTLRPQQPPADTPPAPPPPPS